VSNANVEQGKVIIPGFSPRPTAVTAPVMASSASAEPETVSPNALLDGPVIQRLAAPEPSGDMTVKNGIVSFGK
jgi:hypothetical protein